MKVRIAAPAERHIDTIISAIQTESRTGARNVSRRIREAIRLIGERPHIGRETAREGLLRYPLQRYPYILFYEVHRNEVVIVAIVHGARDPRSMPDSMPDTP